MHNLINAECLSVLADMPDECVSAIVTDPPYGLEFMSKGWDKVLPDPAIWKEALRVAKPGAYFLAFGGTRTFHRLTCAIEDAGWEIRDCMMWVYGSGFPKSLDVSKAIDKAAGAERRVVGRGKGRTGGAAQPNGSSFSDDGYQWPGEYAITAPATPEAQQWQGYGTALKPAWEPIIVARKPLVGTVASNVLKYGTGALNIAGCMVEAGSDYHDLDVTQGGNRQLSFGMRERKFQPAAGRWPANLIHDGSDEVLECFPSAPGQQGDLKGHKRKRASKNALGDFAAAKDHAKRIEDSKSAARFFYCAKASKKDRNSGLPEGVVNNHPTVKPVALMRYLVRLVSGAADNLILDPFMGSGSTGVACALEGVPFAGIEMDPASFEIASLRYAGATTSLGDTGSSVGVEDDEAA